MGECDQMSATMRANSKSFLYNLEKTDFTVKKATKAFLLDNDNSIMCLETTDFDVSRVLVAQTVINFKKDTTLKGNLNEIVFTIFSSLNTMSPEENETFSKNFPDLFICTLDIEEQLTELSSILATWINIIKVDNKKIIFITKSAQNLQKVMIKLKIANIFEIRLNKLWNENEKKTNNEAICTNQTHLVTNERANESTSERVPDEFTNIIKKNLKKKRRKRTKFHGKSTNENLDLINLLESLGVKELDDVIDRFGDTQLHLAAETGKIKIVQSLLLHGAKKDVKNNWGQTALHLAAWKGQSAVVQMLLEYGFDVHATSDDINQWTPLHYACDDFDFHNDVHVVEILLKFGAEMKRKDKFGQTVLHLAAFLGYSAVLNLLLQNGAKINVQDNDGDTPLHKATKSNKPEIVRILLQHGALSNIENKQQKNAIDLAKSRNRTEIIQVFENHE